MNDYTETERRILDMWPKYEDGAYVICDVCGERFDGVAQYMAMGPNGSSLADYKSKYKDAKYCPNCGAKVVEE